MLAPLTKSDKVEIASLAGEIDVYKRQDYKGARIDYNTLLQEEPGNNTARLGRALLNQKELKYRESLEDFNRLVSDNPRDVSYLKARATLAVEMCIRDSLLGHTNIKTTQIYAKITAQKISQDMETLSHKLEDMEKNSCRAI